MTTKQKARLSVAFDIDGEPTEGIKLVRSLLAGESTGQIELTLEVAEQAIDAFADIDLPWLFEEIIESGEEFAKQVHSIATRGLQEVVQNADDQRATEIRFGYRRKAGKSELLIAHDGKPVELEDVMRMALPLISGSRQDPEKIGRFGIGLKTLNQLGERLAVHCPPLPGFEIQRGRIKRIQRAQPAIRGFWSPDERETLFILKLEREEFDWPFFKRWLHAWDASSLLFLRSLRSVSLVNFANRRGKPLRRALELGAAQEIELNMPKASGARQVAVKEAEGRRRWIRYTVDYPRPRRLQATNKEMGETVRLQIAIPHRPASNRVYVGLPLEERCDLPYSLSAPFDPNAERTRLRDNNGLNEWLVGRIGDFATAVSLYRFAEQPRSGWSSVPLLEEAAGDSPWVAERFAEMVARQRKRVAESTRLDLPDGTKVKLGDLAYEPVEFDGLIEPELLDRLWEEFTPEYGPRRAVPRSWRDSGRWRAFLTELEGALPFYVEECLSILDWPDAELAGKDAAWMVEMIAAGLRAEEEKELWERKCVTLAEGGGRLSPAEIEESGMLLVHKASDKGLAAELQLTKQIARPFKARTETAARVREWLSRKGVLRERATDQDALRALARGRLDAPIDLRKLDPTLLRLRDAFDRLSDEEKHKVGQGIGENIGVSGYHFERDKKVPLMVRPGEAYLPSAVDKAKGWPTAAGHTPGLLWVDRRYSTVLKSASRGGGALSFLRAIGSATAPRLVPGPEPSAHPHAPKLVARRNLPAQLREELANHPKATGLHDDWVSPDLEAAVRNLMRERRSTVRRERARALFLALDRAWNDVYLQRTTATAMHHRYSWQWDGEVSATWVAWLASEPWLSTQEPRFHAAPPRELTVLTEAAFEVEGENRRRYAHEIEAKEVDSPVVEALQIQGRPRAGGIVERLETLRRAEAAGEEVEQAWVDHCYRALSSYVPGGPYGDRRDLTESQLKRAFVKGKGSSGLIRADGRWLAPSKVRRGPPLDPDWGWVPAEADPLWDFLGVEQPSAADCQAALAKLSTEAAADARPREILAFRRLLQLRREGRLNKNSLRDLPLRLHGDAGEVSERTVFAVSDAAVAEALGRRWPTWKPPVPVAELAPLLPLLKVELLDEGNFEAEIPAHLITGSFDLQDDFVTAVGHFQDYLAVHHPSLHEKLSQRQWAELFGAHVIVGPEWGVRVRSKRRRSVLLHVRAHLFRDPLRLCLAHESEIEAPDAGGEAIAGFIAGEDATPQDRSTLALAWAYAYSIRQSNRQEISIASPESEAQAAPPPQRFEEFSRRQKRPRKVTRSRGSTPSTPPLPRNLVDLDSLSLDHVKATFLEKKRRTRLKVPPKTKLSDSAQPKRAQAKARSGEQSTHPHYTSREKEDVAFAIVEAYLRAERGLDLEDVRDQNDAGADAVDRGQDIWVELKAHGRDLPDTLRFPRSEAIRAEEKRGHYWLVVVWDLEQPRTPKFSVVPDPLHRLDTYIGSGIQLTGLGDLAD
jgi:hypothetical protein